MEEFFKTPTWEEIDRQWLTQLCYDGQMADDDIEEFVDAILKWKDKSVQRALSDGVERSERSYCPCGKEVKGDQMACPINGIKYCYDCING
jgi:hypothetical protein